MLALSAVAFASISLIEILKGAFAVALLCSLASIAAGFLMWASTFLK